MATKVVVTGGAGLIGTLLRTRLADRYELELLDRRRNRGVGRVDATKLESLESRLRGVDTIIDLAAITRNDLSWREAASNNLPATATVLEAARRCGVPRVVFASSNHVTGLYEREFPYSSIVAGDYDGLDPRRIPLIGPDWPVRPDGPYAIAKALGEAACKIYSECYGFSTLCLRIGTLNRGDRPRQQRDFATLLSHDDLIRLVTCAVDAPAEVKHGIFYGVSANTWRFWDIAGARDVIGFAPRDNAERFRPSHDESPPQAS